MSVNGPKMEEYEFTGKWIGKEWPWSAVEYGVSLSNGKLCMVDESFSQLTDDADIECDNKNIFVTENEEAYQMLFDFIENTPYYEKTAI